jgi:hypothetical protein
VLARLEASVGPDGYDWADPFQWVEAERLEQPSAE